MAPHARHHLARLTATTPRCSNAFLLINNLAALGGEDAVGALTADSALMRELAGWLDSSMDADTLQRLAGRPSPFPLPITLAPPITLTPHAHQHLLTLAPHHASH